MRKLLMIFMFAITLTPGWGASLINDTETERILTELVTPLAEAANIPKERLKIHIINDDEFNAFVTGGEDIFVYTGLLKQIKNPNALQAVVAHEMGHTLGGHMAHMSDRISAEMKRTMLIQALGVGLMVAGGNPTLGAGVMAGSSGIAQQSVLAFTRDEERIADSMGVDLMIKAKQNPNGFITVFEQMHELTGVAESKINPNRINHPLTMERLNNAREYINKNAPEKLRKQNTAPDILNQYELVRAKLVGYLDTQARVRELYPNSDKSDAAIYARAIANMRGGNLDGAMVGTKTLIARQPENPYFYELLGDIQYQYGYFDDSVESYEKALGYAGDAPQIQTALALVLTERNKPGDNVRAIEMCKRSLLIEPAPLTYWVMARAYGEQDSGRADWAMAEYSKMIGNDQDAKKFAKSAMKKLKKSDPEFIKANDIVKL